VKLNYTNALPPPRQFGAIVFALLATFAGATSPAAAVTYVLPSDESMVDSGSAIVFGRILSAAPAPDDPRLPATDFTIDVEEVLKGHVAGRSVIVRQLGGTRTDGLAMLVAGLPILLEGERVLLFLSERDGVLRTVEFALGIFFETRVEGGTLLEREPSLREDVLDLDRQASADREALLGPRDGDRFRRWIRDRAAGVERPTDYFVPERDVVRGPEAVASPYRFLRTSDDCKHPDWSMRWTEFEQGDTVSFRIQEPGAQPVVGNSYEDIRQEIHDAVRAWNRDSLSRVELRYYTRSFQVPYEGPVYRGNNYILWDDPFDQNPGEVGPGGGVVAWAPVWFACNSPPVPHPNGEWSDVRIVQADITTRNGLRTWLWQQDSRDWAMRRNFEAIMAHELGHTLGFGHPCGDDESGERRTTATNEAIMRATAHGDARGARLSSDDLAILRILYPAPASARPPAAPTNVTATPTNNTTVRVTWRDRSYDEEGFVVWSRLAGAGWETALRTQANIEGAHVYGLRPGGRYNFLVRSWRGDLHADSDPVTVTMPSDQTTPGTLQDLQFGVDFSARANGSTTIGKAANWSSDKGVLYWLFDPQNPEALVKVLDGRNINGHWWFDLAVASDLRTVSRVTHRGTGDAWVAITGIGRDVFSEPGETANRLVHCAFPASRADNTCAVSGYGTTISLRDAWESSGRIPSRYFGESSASATGRQMEPEPDSSHRLFVRAQSSHSAANPRADRPIRLPAPSVAAAASPLQGSRFGINFSARANDSTTIGKSADWSSDQGVLYWLFDPQNPEALVKVLDGRSINGHWWFDLAVASDLLAVTRVTHRLSGEEWVATTGFGKDVFSEAGGTEDRLVYCAYPASRADNKCAVWGYGTTISLRDAWDSSGRIPLIHYD